MSDRVYIASYAHLEEDSAGVYLVYHGAPRGHDDMIVASGMTAGEFVRERLDLNRHIPPLARRFLGMSTEEADEWNAEADGLI